MTVADCRHKDCRNPDVHRAGGVCSLGGKQLPPHPPLLPPIRYEGDRPELKLPNRVSAGFDRRKEEDSLLDVGGEVEEVHDLRQPRT